jgi:hypothetical protein
MTGTVTLTDGREVPVTGRLVTGDAGLYRAEAEGSGSKTVAAWILAADGHQPGGLGGEGSLTKLSGARPDPAQPTVSLQGTGHVAHCQGRDHTDPDPLIASRPKAENGRNCDGSAMG